MRKIKQNIWGNWNGYLGGRKVAVFGTDEIAAGYWFLTGVTDFAAGYDDLWIDRCKAAVSAA